MKKANKFIAGILSAFLAVSANSAVVSSVSANAVSIAPVTGIIAPITPNTAKFTNNTWKKSGSYLVSNSKSTSSLTASISTVKSSKTPYYVASFTVKVPSALVKKANNNINNVISVSSISSIMKSGGDTYTVKTTPKPAGLRSAISVNVKNGYQKNYAISVSQNVKITYASGPIFIC